MKRIDYLFKTLVFVYAAYLLCVNYNVTFTNMAMFLGIAAVEIYNEKSDSAIVSEVLFVIIFAACFEDKTFTVLLLCSAYDFLYDRLYFKTN